MPIEPIPVSQPRALACGAAELSRTGRSSRRQWLLQAAAAGAAPAVMSGAAGPLTVSAFEQGGAPCDKRYLETLLLADPSGRPYELVPHVTDPGAATIELPEGKFELSMILPVKDFGSVYLYADDGGALYAPARREFLLNYEFARSRAAFVRRYIKAAQASGVTFTTDLIGRLERGEAALKRATESQQAAARVGYSNESLSETMWAGEMAALERARYRIARQGPRPGFLFGAYSYPFAKTEQHFRLFTNLFNAMTLALYRRGTDEPYFRPGVEREEGKPDYSLAMAAVNKLAGTDITIKGHPLMWFGLPGLPEFLRTKSWEGVKQSCRDHILRTVAQFRSRIHVWDAINEANDTANLLGYNHAQLLELTRFACDTTRVADPTAFRVVNANAPWAEYVQKRHAPDGAKSWSPLAYFTAVEEARIPYEAIGLQFYNPRRDMLEIERQMERFFVFRKPVHITELGVSSSSEPSPRSGSAPSPDVWHGTRWTEQIQADWVEQYYTICYSKAEIEAVIWWNFTDPALRANAGFITEDLRPKEAYHRLLKLVRTWRGV